MRIIARTDTKAVNFLYHIGLAAIENVNTIDERKSKIDRKCFLLSFVARLAIVNTVSCDFIRVRRLFRAFSIAAYPVFLSILHQLCVLLDVVSFFKL